MAAQKEVASHPDNQEVSLISDEELKEIRRIWRTDRQDWTDSVPVIFRAIMERDLDWPVDDLPTFSQGDRQLLDTLCESDGVPPELVAKLLDTERQFLGMRRRAGIFDRIEKVLAENWSSEADILAEASQDC